jgi:mRNA-degrading endonuclease RelE of RelBE toxin-antitoxin system
VSAPAGRAAVVEEARSGEDGMRAIGAAVAALALDPFPPEGFHQGEYHRLRVSRFRVIYVVEDDLTTVERVVRVE